MHSFLKATALAFVLLALTSTRSAASQIDWTGTGEGSVATFSLSNDPLGTPFTDFVGEITWNWVGAPPAGFSSGTLYTYCVDATQYLTGTQTVAVDSTNVLTGASQSNSSVTALGGNAAGENIAWLLNQYSGQAHTDTTGIDAAALQIAIWETLYDGTTDGTAGDPNGLNGGIFQLVNTGNYDYTDIYNKANSDLTGLALGGNTTTSAVFLDTAVGQDQVFTNPTPEPASLILLGSGALALFARRRRSGQTAATL